MAKKAFVYDGTQWVDIAQSTADLSNYANLTTTPISGFRNAIINGDFRINQRGFTSVTTNGTYGFDRWRVGVGGNGTTTYSPVTFTLGNAISGYEPTTHARIVTTGQSTSAVNSILLQPIEDVRTFAGQTITISFWAKANSGTPKVAVELDQQFGTGGSTRVTTYVNQVTLSTSWARYSVTVTVPSISGKTIGTDSYLGLFLWTSAGTDFSARTNSLGIQTNTFDFWGVQVEKGTVATPFEQRPIGTELALCQRYFSQDTFHVSGVWGGSSGELGICAVPFKVTMRDNPNITRISGGVAGDGASDRNVTGITVNQNSKHSARILFQVATNGTVGRGCDVYNVVLSLSAEL